MLARPLLRHILDDDALTRGLGDPEARVLVEWLVDQAEQWAVMAVPEQVAGTAVAGLCRRARSIGRFVNLWCQHRDWGGAAQLAAVERFGWPLPTCVLDPCELMQQILAWEGQRMANAA